MTTEMNPMDVKEPSGNYGQLARMREALNWYGELAQMMQRAVLRGDNQVALHILKEMALDGGVRAHIGGALSAQCAGSHAEGRRMSRDDLPSFWRLAWPLVAIEAAVIFALWIAR
jgi:hypothetical protein